MPSPKNPRKTDTIPASDDPEYIKKTYSTNELLRILAYAQKIDFSNIEVFRKEESTDEEKDLFLKLMQVQMFQDRTIPSTTNVDISSLTLSMILEPRASINIDHEHLPYVVATLIKRALHNWAFIDTQEPVYDRFKNNFNVIYQDIKHLAFQMQSLTDKMSDRLKKILDPLNEFQYPEIQYKLKMLPIALITDLTSNGFKEEAKALHIFINLIRNILEKSALPRTDHEKTLRMLVPSVLSGLKLPLETDTQVYPVIIAMLLMTVREPLFNEEYDPEIYAIYQKLDLKTQALDIGIETSLSLLSDVPEASLSNIIKKHYTDVINEFFPIKKADTIRDQAVLNFFIQTISLQCQFNNSTKGRDIHNLLYMLRLVYAEDENNNTEDGKKTYLKLIRQLLYLPSSKPELDSEFDKVIFDVILSNPDSYKFNELFNPKGYGLDDSDISQYCQQLLKTLFQTQLENSTQKIKIIELQDRLEQSETECTNLKMQVKILKSKQPKVSIEPLEESEKQPAVHIPLRRPRKGSKTSASEPLEIPQYKHTLSDGALTEQMSALSVNDEEGVSPSSSPTHSPPTARNFLHHFKRKKKSVEDQPEPEQAEERIYKRTLSDGSFARKNKK